MGDMADWNIDQGLDSWWAHKAGECDCDGPCQYCDEDLDSHIQPKDVPFQREARKSDG